MTFIKLTIESADKFNVNTARQVYNVSEKQYTTFDHNFGNVDRSTKFFHCRIPEEILYTNIKILHLTLSMFLHYLVNLMSHTQYAIEIDSIVILILQGMRPPE